MIALASDAGYEMDVEDLMNVYSVPIASVDDIWLPEIDVRTLTYRNKLQFNVTCKFPTLDNSESYHIKHWMAEWGKVAELIDKLTRFKLDLGQFLN